MIVKTSVARMTTSRQDSTKYEHFMRLHNSEGKTLDMFMRHSPQEALFLAMELAQLAGVLCDPLIIDGQKIELDKIGKMMLEKD